MSTNQLISIVIPCLNEEIAIPVVLDKIAHLQKQMSNICEVIVVNDGSQDRSGKILSGRKDVLVLESESSQGYGAALKKGFQQAKGDLILFMDMDDTYEVRELEKLLSILDRENSAIVFGNRLSGRTGMPLIRLVGNKFYHYCLKAFSLPHLEDPCTGMRLFKRDLVPAFCALSQNDLSYSMALTMHVLSAQIPYAETRIVYNERIGKSKLNSFLDGWRFLWTILSNRLSA